ncbi:MAG TPA: alpha/beta fold hydrolase [Gemmatimonadaceae bacterium]|nr:alpha/beta fold hydrolase [Gemmatimonadaceae bacterium]
MSKRLLSASLMLAAVLGAPAHAQTGSARLSFTRFTFAAADGSKTEADSATLVVPKNRQHPERGSILIPVVRFRATGAGAGAPIIYLSGGTGSGIAAATGSRYPFLQSLRELGDVITFDLRGAARSTPRVACRAGEPIPVGQPMTYQMLTALLERNARTCVLELRRADVDPAGHNIKETVEDVDALRVAVGAERVRLIGTSTGTQIGLEYLRRHSGQAERIVLLGTQAPDQNLHSPADQERVVRTLDARNRRRAKAGEPPPDLLGSIRKVLGALEAAPQVVRVPNRSGGTTDVALGKFDAQLIVSASLGDRRVMTALIPALSAAAKGDYTVLAQFKMQGARTGITSPFEALFDCQSGAPQARKRMVDREANTALLGLATLDFPGSCTGWMTRELDASYREPVRSRVPVLFVSGTLDGRTPVRNAAMAAESLPNAFQLVVDGASHGDDLFISSPEILENVRAFLAGGRPKRSRIELP